MRAREHTDRPQPGHGPTAWLPRLPSDTLPPRLRDMWRDTRPAFSRGTKRPCQWAVAYCALVAFLGLVAYRLSTVLFVLWRLSINEFQITDIAYSPCEPGVLCLRGAFRDARSPLQVSITDIRGRLLLGERAAATPLADFCVTDIAFRKKAPLDFSIRLRCEHLHGLSIASLRSSCGLTLTAECVVRGRFCLVPFSLPARNIEHRIAMPAGGGRAPDCAWLRHYVSAAVTEAPHGPVLTFAFNKPRLISRLQQALPVLKECNVSFDSERRLSVACNLSFVSQIYVWSDTRVLYVSIAFQRDGAALGRFLVSAARPGRWDVWLHGLRALADEQEGGTAGDGGVSETKSQLSSEEGARVQPRPQGTLKLFIEKYEAEAPAEEPQAAQRGEDEPPLLLPLCVTATPAVSLAVRSDSLFALLLQILRTLLPEETVTVAVTAHSHCTVRDGSGTARDGEPSANAGSPLQPPPCHGTAELRLGTVTAALKGLDSGTRLQKCPEEYFEALRLSACKLSLPHIFNAVRAAAATQITVASPRGLASLLNGVALLRDRGGNVALLSVPAGEAHVLHGAAREPLRIAKEKRKRRPRNAPVQASLTYNRSTLHVAAQWTARLPLGAFFPAMDAAGLLVEDAAAAQWRAGAFTGRVAVRAQFRRAGTKIVARVAARAVVRVAAGESLAGLTREDLRALLSEAAVETRLTTAAPFALQALCGAEEAPAGLSVAERLFVAALRRGAAADRRFLPARQPSPYVDYAMAAAAGEGGAGGIGGAGAPGGWQVAPHRVFHAEGFSPAAHLLAVVPVWERGEDVLVRLQMPAVCVEVAGVRVVCAESTVVAGAGGVGLAGPAGVLVDASGAVRQRLAGWLGSHAEMAGLAELARNAKAAEVAPLFDNVLSVLAAAALQAPGEAQSAVPGTAVECAVSSAMAGQGSVEVRAALGVPAGFLSVASRAGWFGVDIPCISVVARNGAGSAALSVEYFWRGRGQSGTEWHVAPPAGSLKEAAAAFLRCYAHPRADGCSYRRQALLSTQRMDAVLSEYIKRQHAAQAKKVGPNGKVDRLMTALIKINKDVDGPHDPAEAPQSQPEQQPLVETLGAWKTRQRALLSASKTFASVGTHRLEFALQITWNEAVPARVGGAALANTLDANKAEKASVARRRPRLPNAFEPRNNDSLYRIFTANFLSFARGETSNILDESTQKREPPHPWRKITDPTSVDRAFNAIALFPRVCDEIAQNRQMRAFREACVAWADIEKARLESKATRNTALNAENNADASQNTDVSLEFLEKVCTFLNKSIQPSKFKCFNKDGKEKIRSQELKDEEDPCLPEIYTYLSKHVPKCKAFERLPDADNLKEHLAKRAAENKRTREWLAGQINGRLNNFPEITESVNAAFDAAQTNGSGNKEAAAPAGGTTALFFSVDGRFTGVLVDTAPLKSITARCLCAAPLPSLLKSQCLLDYLAGDAEAEWNFARREGRAVPMPEALCGAAGAKRALGRDGRESTGSGAAASSKAEDCGRHPLISLLPLGFSSSKAFLTADTLAFLPAEIPAAVAAGLSALARASPVFPALCRLSLSMSVPEIFKAVWNNANLVHICNGRVEYEGIVELAGGGGRPAPSKPRAQCQCANRERRRDANGTDGDFTHKNFNNLKISRRNSGQILSETARFSRRVFRAVRHVALPGENDRIRTVAEYIREKAHQRGVEGVWRGLKGGHEWAEATECLGVPEPGCGAATGRETILRQEYGWEATAQMICKENIPPQPVPLSPYDLCGAFCLASQKSLVDACELNECAKNMTGTDVPAGSVASEWLQSMPSAAYDTSALAPLLFPLPSVYLCGANQPAMAGQVCQACQADRAGQAGTVERIDSVAALFPLRISLEIGINPQNECSLIALDPHAPCTYTVAYVGRTLLRLLCGPSAQWPVRLRWFLPSHVAVDLFVPFRLAVVGEASLSVPVAGGALLVLRMAGLLHDELGGCGITLPVYVEHLPYVFRPAEKAGPAWHLKNTAGGSNAADKNVQTRDITRENASAYLIQSSRHKHAILRTAISTPLPLTSLIVPFLRTEHFRHCLPEVLCFIKRCCEALEKDIEVIDGLTLRARAYRTAQEPFSKLLYCVAEREALMNKRSNCAFARDDSADQQSGAKEEEKSNASFKEKVLSIMFGQLETLSGGLIKRARAIQPSDGLKEEQLRIYNRLKAYMDVKDTATDKALATGKDTATNKDTATDKTQKTSEESKPSTGSSPAAPKKKPNEYTNDPHSYHPAYTNILENYDDYEVSPRYRTDISLNDSPTRLARPPTTDKNFPLFRSESKLLRMVGLINRVAQEETQSQAVSAPAVTHRPLCRIYTHAPPSRFLQAAFADGEPIWLGAQWGHALPCATADSVFWTGVEDGICAAAVWLEAYRLRLHVFYRSLIERLRVAADRGAVEEPRTSSSASQVGDASASGQAGSASASGQAGSASASQVGDASASQVGGASASGQAGGTEEEPPFGYPSLFNEYQQQIAAYMKLSKEPNSGLAFWKALALVFSAVERLEEFSSTPFAAHWNCLIVDSAHSNNRLETFVQRSAFLAMKYIRGSGLKQWLARTFLSFCQDGLSALCKAKDFLVATTNRAGTAFMETFDLRTIDTSNADNSPGVTIKEIFDGETKETNGETKESRAIESSNSAASNSKEIATGKPENINEISKEPACKNGGFYRTVCSFLGKITSPFKTQALLPAPFLTNLVRNNDLPALLALADVLIGSFGALHSPLDFTSDEIVRLSGLLRQPREARRLLRWLRVLGSLDPADRQALCIFQRTGQFDWNGWAGRGSFGNQLRRARIAALAEANEEWQLESPSSSRMAFQRPPSLIESGQARLASAAGIDLWEPLFLFPETILAGLYGHFGLWDGLMALVRDVASLSDPKPIEGIAQLLNYGVQGLGREVTMSMHMNPNNIITNFAISSGRAGVSAGRIVANMTMGTMHMVSRATDHGHKLINWLQLDTRGQFLAMWSERIMMYGEATFVPWVIEWSKRSGLTGFLHRIFDVNKKDRRQQIGEGFLLQVKNGLCMAGGWVRSKVGGAAYFISTRLGLAGANEAPALENGVAGEAHGNGGGLQGCVERCKELLGEWNSVDISQGMGAVLPSADEMASALAKMLGMGNLMGFHGVHVHGLLFSPGGLAQPSKIEVLEDGFEPSIPAEIAKTLAAGFDGKSNVFMADAAGEAQSGVVRRFLTRLNSRFSGGSWKSPLPWRIWWVPQEKTTPPVVSESSVAAADEYATSLGVVDVDSSYEASPAAEVGVSGEAEGVIKLPMGFQFPTNRFITALNDMAVELALLITLPLCYMFL